MHLIRRIPRMAKEPVTARNSNRHKLRTPTRSHAHNLRCKICVLRGSGCIQANPRMPEDLSLALHRIQRIHQQIVAHFKHRLIEGPAQHLHSTRRRHRNLRIVEKHIARLFVRRRFSTKYTVALARVGVSIAVQVQRIRSLIGPIRSTAPFVHAKCKVTNVRFAAKAFGIL